MTLKRNILLGLMVFMVGVLLTACGGSGSGAPAATKKDIPDSWEDAKCKSCTYTYPGTFRVTDDSLFLEAVGVESNGGLGWGDDSLFGLILGSFTKDVIEPGLELAYCYGVGVVYNAIADALKVDDTSLDCTNDDIEIFEARDDDRVKSSYKGTLRVTYADYEVERLDLHVDSNIESEDFRDVFYHSEGKTYENSEGNMVLINNGGRVRLSTTSGRVIGEFRD